MTRQIPKVKAHLWRLRWQMVSFLAMMCLFGEVVDSATPWPHSAELHAHHDRKKFTRPRKDKSDAVDTYY